MEVIHLKNVNKYYKNGTEKQHVLKDINLSVKKGEFLVILGPSGSGKSTVLNLIGGLDTYESGEIIVDGKEYNSQKDEVMSEYRRKKLGFVFQSFNLIPVLSVYENIVFPIQIDGKKEDKAYIENLLKELGIYEKKDVFPAKLSGGQQQRVAIARALANKPQIILADEPTGNLDTETGNDVLKILMEGVKKYGQTLIMITHNQEIAKQADRVVYIRDGVISEK